MSDKDYEWLPHKSEDELVGGYKPEAKDSNVVGLVVPVKLQCNATLPTKGSGRAAAYDVYALKSVELQAGQTVIVSTGLFISLPEGYDLKVIPRSGLSSKGITIRNSPGLVDEDYRGEVGVILKYEPENLCLAVLKLYKALHNFTKNLVSGAQFNIDAAKTRLAQDVNVNLFEPYKIEAGHRIAQVQLQKVVPFTFQEVKELDETDRGTGGFGSTGD